MNCCLCLQVSNDGSDQKTASAAGVGSQSLHPAAGRTVSPTEVTVFTSFCFKARFSSLNRVKSKLYLPLVRNTATTPSTTCHLEQEVELYFEVYIVVSDGIKINVPFFLNCIQVALTCILVPPTRVHDVGRGKRNEPSFPWKRHMKRCPFLMMAAAVGSADHSWINSQSAAETIDSFICKRVLVSVCQTEDLSRHVSSR